MRSTPGTARVSLTLLLWAAAVPAASAAPPESALAVGVSAPAFSLVDQAGQTRTLAEFVAEGPVALLFYRSADW